MATTEQQAIAHDELPQELADIVGDENVLADPEELLVYECDGLPQHKHPPRAVVFPTSTEETSDVIKLLAQKGVSFAPRGAGTGLSGGALAVNRGVVIEMARMRSILNIDPENRVAVVQTGLVNLQLSRAVGPYGLYYVPDPSSQPACTIGGNIAENAGGIHCLKYGTTTDHVLAARVVLADGTILDLDRLTPGYDLLGVFVGSEGTFGIATEATVRLSKSPQAVRTLLADFLHVDDASRAVSAIIAAGMLPAALEMMDHEIIRAIEASVFTAGLPLDAQAVLLVELDGVEAGIDDETEKAEAVLRQNGARSVQWADDESRRKKLWAARKGAFGAVGRLSPDIMIQDAVVPRSRLPEVLAETYRISSRRKIILANVFHAGDGNLHPLICFDGRRADDVERVRQAGREIMEVCVRAGGSITGEHGVGLDKSIYLPLIFSDDDMDAMLRVRAAFDPSGLCNPGKIIPVPRGCGEARAVATATVVDPDQIARALKPNGRAVTPAPANLRVAARMNEVRVMNQLKQMIGVANVRKLADTPVADGNEFAANYERALVLSPESAAEISDAIDLARQERFSVVPAGNLSAVDAGNELSSADLLLSTRRLTKMIRHEPADLVATAEAGITLREFQKQLAARGQWLPVDPPDDGTATIGGVVATGVNGPHATGHGSVRTFVIGLRTVLANGRTIKAGGSVVKNVAGYDLCKLFTGSWGTLGLITELTFKLRPLPAETRTIIALGSLTSLIESARSIANQYSPVAVELVSSRLGSDLGTGGGEGDCALLVRFAGSARAVITQTAQALKVLRDSTRSCETRDDDADLWQRLSASSCVPAYDLRWRAAAKPPDVAALLKEIAKIEADEALHIGLRWHAAPSDGRVRAFGRAPAYPRKAARALEHLRQRIETSGGNLALEKAPLEIKNQVDCWGSFGTVAELMRRLKTELDPENMFSPGRM